MAFQSQRGHSNPRGGSRGTSRGGARGRGRGRGGARGSSRPGGGPRLPGLLSDELGVPRSEKPPYREKQEPGAGRGRGRAGNHQEPRDRSFAGSSRTFARERDERPPPPPQKRKRDASPVTHDVVDSEDEEETRERKEVKLPKMTIEKGSGFRTKVSSNAITPLARLLASQNKSSTHPSSDEEDDEPHTHSESSKKRKTSTTKATKPDPEKAVDPSIMGSKYATSGGGGEGTGKKSQAELDEDAEIAWLEYQLRKGKGKGGKGGVGEEDGLEDDGLDELLSFADTIVPFGDDAEDDEEELLDGEDEEQMEEMEMDDVFSEDDEAQEDEELEAFYTSDSDNADDMDDQDSTAALTRANTNVNATTSSTQTALLPRQASPPIQPTSTTTTRTQSSEIEKGKYVPPHMRALIASSTEVENGTAKKVEKTEEQVKLERRMQGLLNKLSEANIESIVGEVEALYRDHSRNSVTSTVTELVINLVSDRANLLDSFVILYAALLAALYKVKGLEFGASHVMVNEWYQKHGRLILLPSNPMTGAHVVQTLVLKYKSLVDQLQGTAAEEEQAGKQPLNMLTLIAELYNFQVISCRLIYDLIRGFIENIVPQGQEVTGVEFPVEGLLKVLRASGSQLRADDPTSLKDIVQLVQQKTAGQEAKMSTRSKFMVETLVNVKNNKMRAIPGGEIAAESTQKMKRIPLILAHEPIRVSLDDLLNAETKGKWWLVGAAWAGNPLVDRQREQEALKSRDAAVKKVVSTADNDDDDELNLLGMDNHEELIKLAKKQGMNTDIRRSIFIIMMTSDDYVHACDRLSALKFNETQQRDFVRVALHCCGVETRYNPYYTLILQNLCESSFSHRFTFQYAMWDFLREMGETDVGGAAVINSGGHSGTMGFGSDNKVSKTRIANLAKMCGWLIAKGAVDLTIFKPVDFTALQSKTKTFFRTTIAYIFLGVRTESPLFKLPASKISKSGKPIITQAIEDAHDLLRATFQKALAHTSLAQGMNFFLRSGEMKKVVNGDMLEGIGDEGRAVVKDGLKLAKEVLVVAA
ncbi:hypothetical protein QFC21_006973 [Naganishia friedmannii]|uniref:Uncharacterized protein n=1 Tax=Naganishia friedmannii TaxID=89922 RepID=A0ACC2UYR0_9TREE|nr:hypothetical protein QFC21_006973 [Naganishia friedmannii]